ncbi:MAG: hypothetical protein WBX01_11915 [Nitrososphaeraceae archaeon]
MSKRQKTLVRFQNGKLIPTKTQIVVSCVKNESVEETEKLQNKSITYTLKRTNRSEIGPQNVFTRMNDFRHVNGGNST